MSSASPWVLKKFQIDHSGMTGTHLNVEARQPGFGAFLLNLMGLDPNASVKVTNGAISMRQASIYGMDQVTAALTSVGAFLGGYKKPVEYLFLAAFFFCGGLIGGIAVIDAFGFIFTFGCVCSLCCFVLYVFNKQMYIGFETSGGEKHTLVFKQAVIEGVRVDIARVEQAILMVNDLISEAASGKSVQRTIQTSNLASSSTITVAQSPAPAPAPMAAPVPVPIPAPAPVPMPAPAHPAPGPARPGPAGPFNQ